MAITTRNKVSVSFAMSGMTDIVFLLLIFFMITSTLIAPNALKLLLPQSNNQTQANPITTVSITRNLEYYIETTRVEFSQLEFRLRARLSGEEEPTISLLIDKNTSSVDVFPGSSGEANFTLTIWCSLPYNISSSARVGVELDLQAGSWMVGELPLLVFDRAVVRRDARITVTAPINTSAETIVDLEVRGTWSYMNTTQSGTINRITLARIDVNPFYDIFIGSNNPKKYADVGDWAEFSFNITNRANLDVNMLFEIENDNEHLIVEFDDSRLPMEKGETKTLTLRVKQEPSRSRGNTIHVKARIEGDPQVTEWDLPLLFYTEPTMSTFFYERNFVRLILIILVIAGVSAGLFLWEYSRKDKECGEDEKGPEKAIRNSRPFDFPDKR